MTARGAAAKIAVLGAGVLLLLLVRPGVVLNGARSPRVWLVVGLLLLAGPVLSAAVRRAGGRPRLAGAVGTAVPLAVAALLLAPSFSQRELVEPFPVVAAGPAPVASVLPAAPTAAVRSAAPPAAPPAAAPPAAAPPVAAPRAAQPPAAQPAPARPAPARSSASRPSPASPAAAPAPRARSAGSLEGINHRAKGRTVLYDTDSGPLLRFEDIDVEGTPGPVVYLVPRGTRTPDRGVRLGALKAERGSFGYSLPPGVDPAGPWTVLVWCTTYDTPIAAADLS